MEQPSTTDRRRGFPGGLRLACCVALVLASCTLKKGPGPKGAEPAWKVYQLKTRSALRPIRS